MFSADDLDTMQLLRCAFDPAGLCNPGKIFPTPRLCGEVPGVRRGPHPLVAAGQVGAVLMTGAAEMTASGSCRWPLTTTPGGARPAPAATVRAGRAAATRSPG